MERCMLYIYKCNIFVYVYINILCGCLKLQIAFLILVKNIVLKIILKLNKAMYSQTNKYFQGKKILCLTTTHVEQITKKILFCYKLFYIVMSIIQFFQNFPFISQEFKMDRISMLRSYKFTF